MADDIVVILQVRSSSKRLPYKAMLTAGGYPLFVLSALRAKNSGRKVIVATSDQTEDDPIESLCRKYQLQCARGSLPNVLNRFSSTLEGMHSETVVVRLTADNVVPDGHFIDSLINEFIRKGRDYLRTDMEKMPYGLSAEIFRKKAIDLAMKANTSEEDQEHVTPWIRRNFEDYVFTLEEFNKFQNLRITVDTAEDYRNLLNVINHLNNPLDASIEQFLKAFQKEMNRKNLLQKLVLGGAQIGSAYGITNQIKNTSEVHWFSIMSKAHSEGITKIDTARVYTGSEEVIGRFLSEFPEKAFELYTKLSPGVHDVQGISKDIQLSQKNLNGQKPEVFMFHRYADFPTEWKEKGIPDSLKGINFGISVQNVEELKSSLRLPVKHIQMPFNILDHRWRTPELFNLLRDKGSIKIHVRSIFLQGLLLCENQSLWPKLSQSYDPEKIITKISQLKEKLKCTSVREMIFSYLLSFPWIDGIVVGVTSPGEIAENIRSLSVQAFSEAELNLIHEELNNIYPDELLNPANWIRE